MASVDDVAAAILKRTGSIDTFKLQKLVYYSQAWHLVWDEKPLFAARIEAWANGPVVPKLYQQHKGQFRVSSWPSGEANRLSASEKETIKVVIDYYGGKPGYVLSELTHKEPPWRDARAAARLAPGERGKAEISHAAMAEYYGGLVGTSDDD